MFLVNNQSGELFLLKYFAFPTAFKPFCRGVGIGGMVVNTGDIFPVVALCVTPGEIIGIFAHIAETAQYLPVGHITGEALSAAVNVVKILMVKGLPIPVGKIERIVRME